MYVANTGDNTVSVIATATNAVVTTVPVGLAPQAVAVTPDGSRVYVTNTNDNTLSVIDPTQNTVVATVQAVGLGPIAWGKFIGPH
jgi:YVTN family beta-propeller protein